MTKKTPNEIDELRGATRLVVEATKGVTSVVEAMHRSIASGPNVLGRPLEGPARVVTQIVYSSIRGVTHVVGASLDRVLEQLVPLFGQQPPGPERDALRSVVNGVLGDYLVATDNPLALAMQLRRQGEALDLDDREGLRAAVPDATGELLITVHGLCMNDRQWLRQGHDHAAELAAELGWTRVDVRYNTGLHISSNGETLATLLDQLVTAWPVAVERITILGHSMGGLVARSACRAAELAGQPWRGQLRSLVFLGTPHHGAPLERGGNWLEVLLGVSPYSAPLAQLGRIRSAGVTDLRYGNLVEEHWRDRDRFELAGDPRTPLPLPAEVACHAVAGSLAEGLGDGLVPVASALGEHERRELALAFPEGHTATVAGVGHLELLDHPEVYARLRAWLGPG